MRPTKPIGIFDREAEWQALEALWSRRRPELAFVLGRRRIGKSFVLSRFARLVGGVYYQATRRTESEQLAHLSRIIGDRFDDPALRRGVAFPSWERLLEYVTDRAAGEPFLLVLDEFPYLAAAAPALTSVLQSAWDHAWSESQIKLVLSGSFITAMRTLEDADQPLFGRRTARLVFGPFSFADARAFMPGWGEVDQLLAYSVFGNSPGHLARIDAERSVAENIAAAVLSPQGPLVDEAQHMLDAFITDARVHYSILEAIASGDHTWSGITRRVGLAGGSLLRPLRWLIEMGLVMRIVPVSEKAPQRSKRAVYRIADPYIEFWHRIVSPLVHAGSVGLVEPMRLWTELVQPQLGEQLGRVFEEVCRQFVRRSTHLPISPVRVGEWWDAESRHQVDIVAIDAGGAILLAECKWGAVTREDLAALRARADLVVRDLGRAPATHLALFSARDLADPTVRDAVAAGEVLWFTAADVARA